MIEDDTLNDLRDDSMPLEQKLKRLWGIIWNTKVEGSSKFCDVFSLQRLIRDSMLVWSKDCIRNPKLVEEIFLLLFRQFDMIQETITTVRNAYIIDDSSGLYDISLFKMALGTLRGLVNVAMGREEEKILKTCLKYGV